ncbi:hypothetical protein AB1Y20_001107 [Prymnesium parvum]|uniref:HAT C-terminal dimerisation domain-containing protein n=1 Tax=Prymnesium parvum TaxID=97485 RepID=A0AB34KBM1_PRYPA|mmetsp:Transcript_20564/g.51379  ORF Transcript_20564/g.51379 Transcript_20564/m.51379 type:complete len:274 (+) Transcript_20564:258-1079(+)
MILHIAMPLIKLLRMMDGNKPVLGKIYDRMFIIGERLRKLKENNVPWASFMEKKHAERWEYLHSPFHSIAYALDPEFLECVGNVDAATQEGVLTVIERLCLLDAITESSKPEEAWKTLSTTSPKVVAKIAQAEREFAAFRRPGAFTRPSVLENAKTLPPSEWWGTYAAHLPLLASIATRVLSQPGAASVAERNWSIYGQIRTSQKSRMKHSTADKLVFLHESLHLEQKRMDAGWEPEVEKWDTDTDSDDSDDELDINHGDVQLTAEAIRRLCA